MKTLFYPIEETKKCGWCENNTRTAVFSTEKEIIPICIMHYQFFTEPAEWNAWKDRDDGVGLRRKNYIKRESWKDK